MIHQMTVGDRLVRKEGVRGTRRGAKPTNRRWQARTVSPGQTEHEHRSPRGSGPNTPQHTRRVAQLPSIPAPTPVQCLLHTAPYFVCSPTLCFLVSSRLVSRAGCSAEVFWPPLQRRYGSGDITEDKDSYPRQRTRYQHEGHQRLRVVIQCPVPVVPTIEPSLDKTAHLIHHYCQPNQLSEVVYSAAIVSTTAYSAIGYASPS